MHKNIYWLLFLAVLGLCVMYYTVYAFGKIYSYSRLKASAQAESVRGRLQVLSEDEDRVWLEYEFMAGNVPAKGRSEIAIIPNTPVAPRELNDYLQEQWTVWYDPEDPSYSTLQKKFPLKEFVSALVLWGLYLYFVGIGIYVNKRRG